MGEAAEELAELQREIETLLARLAEAERRWQHLIVPTDPENRCSATNLVHYWAMRQVDLRDLQYRLACFGLSSLGRSEAHVQATLHGWRRRSPRCAAGAGTPDHAAVEISDGPRLLDRNATALLGPAPQDRAARIMVTLPSEAMPATPGWCAGSSTPGCASPGSTSPTTTRSPGRRWPPTSARPPWPPTGRAWWRWTWPGPAAHRPTGARAAGPPAATHRNPLGQVVSAAGPG